MAEKTDRPETDQVTQEQEPVPEVTASIHHVTVFRNGALVVRRGSGSGAMQVNGLPLFTRGICFTLTDSAGEADFEIEYFVPAARWVPTYTLDLSAGRARIELSALVAQATGEAWQGASLSFSTADLARETTLPELTSWRIGRAQTPRRPVFRSLPTDLEVLFAEYDRGIQQPQPVAAEEIEIAAAMGGALHEDLAETTLDDTGVIILEETFALETPPLMAPQAPVAAGLIAAETDLMAGAQAPERRRRPPTVEVAPEEPLPPRLRYAYLRLVGPDEPHRGTLQPMDPLHHLFALVADHEKAKIEDLRRAIAALREAAERLRNEPIPPGTTPLESTSFHHSFKAPGHHTLPTDGCYHRLLVESTEAPATEELRTVPRGGSEPEAVRNDLDPFDQNLDGGLRWTVDIASGETVEVAFRYRISLPAKMELQGGNRRE